ncbi:DUF551 domain-containing protein [Enterobacter asburiae]|uniref:DUF551 domain-containing protein n=1 Tax=Enterobacter asburiae TaxID=61645 RepID=UPI003BEF25A4
MSTITKEWLKQKIADMEAARDEIPFGLDEDDSNTLAALRIALESLEAEAVCVIDQSNLDYLKSGSDADVWPASRAEMGDVLLYRSAPPAPVSVPDAMEMDDDFDSAFEHGKAVGWNACRAAILQRAEPVQGWIPCSDRMPTKNHRVLIFINFNSDTVPPSIHDAQFTGSTFRRGNATVNVFPLEDGYGVTHWMPLPAAPQQGA